MKYLKKLSVSIFIAVISPIFALTVSSNTLAQSDEIHCVDLAEGSDLVAFHNCENDSKLNRALKGLFGNKTSASASASAVADSRETASSITGAVEPVPDSVEKGLNTILSTSLSTNLGAIDSDSLKPSLKTLLEVCPEGFDIVTRRYRPISSGLSEQLVYRCL